MRVADLAEAAKHRIPAEWNSTQRDFPPVCLHELIEAQARQTPDSVAVADAKQQLTYRELNARANQLARYLRKLGVGPEVLVGIALERSAELLVALLGILKAGGAYVPLDPEYPLERLAFMAKDSGLRGIVTQGGLLEKLPEGAAPRIDPDTERGLIAKESREDFPSGAGPDNLVYVIYTSGSTGLPKGVEITHRSLANLVLWHRDAFEVTAADRATLFSSPAFDASVWEIGPYLSVGAGLVLPDETTRLSPDLLRDWLVANRITIGFFPTALAEQLIALEWPDNTSLRIMLTGADRLRHYPSETLPFALVNNYGPTEATVVTTSGRVPSEGRGGSLPSIGRPIANVEVYILNEKLRPVVDGEAGELCIGGVGLARGYHQRPELTAEKFIPNPFSARAESRLYRTGDVARVARDGQLEFVGRLDEQVKIRGYRVETGEIEAVLGEHGGVEAAVVVARQETPEDARLVAYVVPRAGQRPAIEELRNALKRKLPEWMLPARFEFLEAMPLTPSGKVDRRALPTPGTSRPLMAASGTTARTDLEQKLAELFAKLLRLDHVGIDEDFFDLGGDSLVALKLIAKLEKAMGQRISLASLFHAPTVRELAAFLSDHRSTHEILRALPIQAQGSRPPFFCVGGGPSTRALAQRLAPEQPFLGLVFEEAELQTLPAPFRVEDLAAILVRKMQAEQRTGPYFLGGWCFYGCVAYEMARQLRASGEEVELLILIYMPPPPQTPVPSKAEGSPGRTSRVTQRISFILYQLRTRGWAYVWKGLKRRVGNLGTRMQYSIYKFYRRRGLPIRGWMRSWSSIEDFAYLDYQPQPYWGRVALVRPEPRERTPGPEEDDWNWRALAKGELQVHFVPYAEIDVFLEPNLEVTAKKLKELLLEAQRSKTQDRLPSGVIA